MESFNKTIQNITEEQMSSLDDSDMYSSIWSDAVTRAMSSPQQFVSWGGKGRGGRGLARRTWQPYDIVVPDVNLEYVPETCAMHVEESSVLNESKGSSQSRTLLKDAYIKLLSGGKVYGLCGRNGVGKSTLLRRMETGKIPGWPVHISSLYISQDTSIHFSAYREDSNPQKIQGRSKEILTPIQLVLNHYHTLRAKEQLLSQQQVQSLEEQIQQLDIENNPGDSEKLQLLCEKLSSLDEEWGEDDEGKALQEAKIEKAKEALLYLAVPEHLHNSSMENLSPGMVQKVLLACAYFYQPQLLLLDEPTKDMDVIGLVKLRRMIYEFTESGSPNPRRTTVVLVSHDMDLMNDVVTDIIYFHDLKLEYYPNCNYCGFLKLKFDRDIHSLRETHLLDVKRTKMIESIDKMKERTLSGDASSVGAKKLQKVIENKQKKLDKAGIERDAKGHRWQMQKMGTGMKIGSINSVDTSSRKKISYGQLVKMTGANVARLIDKAIQFKFRECTSMWGGDLIKLIEVGHGYATQSDVENGERRIPMLFDGVDLCIAEHSRTFIIGGNGSGKSTLLKILAGVLNPLQGRVYHANNLQIGYFDQKMTDNLLQWHHNNVPYATALSVLREEFPTKTEQDLRGELTSFGIGPSQATNKIKFLSGGERCRVCLAIIMLRNPDILLLDEVTNHLDIESVEAIIYGLKNWNGTIVIVSHDANLIRELGGTCYIVLEKQKRVLRLIGGIDAYLKALQVH